MNLEQYHIDFNDHHNSTDIATEGFFMDDKNPNIKSFDVSGTNVTEIIKYKGIEMVVPGINWAEVFIGNHPKTTEGFKRNGLQFLSKVNNELLNAEQFVKSNSTKYREAVATKNIEVMTNLAEGLRNCFPTLLDYTHAVNRGNAQFGGNVLEMDEQFKKKLIDALNKFQRIYRDIAVLLAKNYITEHAAKSTLKKIFRHTLKAHADNSYLESELYAYCRDVHLHVQDALYS